MVQKAFPVSAVYCSMVAMPAVTLDFLAASDVQLATHPTYSSDVAPCDRFLFPSVERQLKESNW